MALRKITDNDLAGKGVIGMADVPGLSAREMQQKVEEIVRDVVIPVLNENIDKTATIDDLGNAVFNAGAGDMATYIYDADKDGTVNSADNGIFEYTHSKSGTVHNLEGRGGNGVFWGREDWKEGDSLTVNGIRAECLNGNMERIENEKLFAQNGCVYVKIVCVDWAGEPFYQVFFKVGGAGLNFKIVGGTAEPSNPKENTIWVKTSTAISEYRLSPIQPTKRADGTSLQTGDVWIKTNSDGYGNGAFNALKKNGLQIYANTAYQWNGSYFIQKEAKVYRNGGWYNLTTLLFNNGVFEVGYKEVNDFALGSWYTLQGTLSVSSTINITVNDEKYEKGIVFDAVDVTNFNTLRFTIASMGTTHTSFFGLSTTEENCYDNRVAHASYNGSTVTEVNVDISELSGKYYPFAGALGTHNQAPLTIKISRVELL